MHIFNLVFHGPCKCFVRIANVVTSMKAGMKLLLLRHYNPQRKQSLNIVVIFLLSLRDVQRLKLAFTFACFKCFEHFLTSLERFLTEIKFYPYSFEILEVK